MCILFPFVLGAVPIKDLISLITLLFFIAFTSGLTTTVVQGDHFHLLGDCGRSRCVGQTFKQVNFLGAGVTSQGWAGHVVAPEGDLWFNVTEMGEKRRRRKEGSGQGKRGAAFIYILQTSHLPVRLISRRLRGAPGRERELFCFDKVSKKTERCLGLRSPREAHLNFPEPVKNNSSEKCFNGDLISGSIEWLRSLRKYQKVLKTSTFCAF